MTDRMIAVSELRSALEVAKMCECTVTTVSRWANDGTLVPLRRAPLIFHVDDVNALKRQLEGGRLPRRYRRR
jgi:DNA-binding transcriptional MerR regulator